MKDYFTLDGKIEENRRYLRETQDKYEKIRQYYPLFFLYVGFIGYYSFEILQWFIGTFTCSGFYLAFGGFLLIHVGVFVYTFYLFSKVLRPEDVAIEAKPKIIYQDYDNQKTNKVKKNNDLEVREKESYLLGLEEDVSKNLSILVKKKKYLSNVIKYSLLSFIIYLVLITTYKITTVGKNTDKARDKIVVRKEVQLLKDGKEPKGVLSVESDSAFTEEAVEWIREIVRDECKKIKEEENKKIVKESTDDMVSKFNYGPKK